MDGGWRIVPVRAEAEVEAVVGLFHAYAASLHVDLGYQDFEAELAALPGKYAPPSGELLLAQDMDGEALGCVGLRSLAADGECEMKRLFLLPAARGRGLGLALTEAVIATARRLAYRQLRLDTLPTMSTAIALYETLGFERTEPYYGPTPTGTVFFRLAL